MIKRWLPVASSDFRRRIYQWNDIFPLDGWWRNKYKISFGTEQHKSMSFFDVLFEFREFVQLELEEKSKEKGEVDGELERELFGDKPQNVVKMSAKEEQQTFDELDIDQFDDKKE